MWHEGHLPGNQMKASRTISSQKRCNASRWLAHHQGSSRDASWFAHQRLRRARHLGACESRWIQVSWSHRPCKVHLEEHGRLNALSSTEEPNIQTMRGITARAQLRRHRHGDQTWHGIWTRHRRPGGFHYRERAAPSQCL